MHKHGFLTFSGLILMATGLTWGAGPKEVSVDCSHQTISDAVTGLDNDKEYVVSVTGICNENVRIADFQGISLTVQGSPSATINGVTASPFGVPVVQILNSRRVTIANFAINATGSIPTGNPLALTTNFCANCLFANLIVTSPRSGVSFADSQGLATKISVTLSPAPVGTAMGVLNASDMNLQALQLTGPGGPPFTGTGLLLDGASRARIGLNGATPNNTLIQGFGQGIIVRDASSLDGATPCGSPQGPCSSVQNNNQGIRLEAAQANLNGFLVDNNKNGGILVGTESTIELIGPFTISNTTTGIGLAVTHNSHAALFNFGSPSIAFTFSNNPPRDVSIGSLSSVQFNAGITSNGNINCDSSSLITGTPLGSPTVTCANTNPNPTPLP